MARQPEIRKPIFTRKPKPAPLPDCVREIVVPLYQLRLHEIDVTTVQVKAPQRSVPLRMPEQVYDLAKEFIGDMDQEALLLFCVTTKHRLIASFQVSLGTLTTTLINPREVFRTALRCNAYGIVLAHNHPSGDPHPSREDRGVTRRLIEAGALMGIEVLDHVIVGKDRFVSLRDEGLVDWS